MSDLAALRRRFSRRSLVDCFSEQVELAPDAIAVFDRTDTVTYSELGRAAFGLANDIVDRLGVGSEPVLVLMHQGLAAITATVAVLAAGKYYVPVDPGGPPGHTSAVIGAVEPRLIICEPAHAVLAATLGTAAVLVLDGFDSETSSDPPVGDVAPSDVAYIYFTSGSTGQPKGVVDTHANVLHNVFWYTSMLEFAPTDRMSLIQSPSVSGVVSTQFGALCNGAALCPIQFGPELPTRVASALEESEITTFHAVPALFRFLAEFGLGEIQSLRLVRLEGDRAASVDVSLLRREFGPEVTLANGLGATECGLVRQLLVSPGQSVPAGPLPVGYPVPDVEVAIVDPDGSPVPTGSQGEVVVRSEYLASGYWRNDELTDIKFEAEGANGRRYRTGDVG